MNKKVKIALTMGCPEGVGPELAVSTAAKLAKECDITIYGDKDILKKAFELRHPRGNPSLSPLPAVALAKAGWGEGRGEGEFTTHNLNIRNVKGNSFDILEAATNDVIADKADALVTCPINKRRWNEAGVQFTGHTEYLAKRTGAAGYAMMMASPKLKITLATIHEPVKNIAPNLTREKIVTAALLTHDALKKYFAISVPRIAVTALNPHCGDGGLLGDEEMTVIAPAIEELHQKNIEANGPFSADAIFGRAINGEYDAVIAMYHDQGLPVIKTLYNKETVNITLGLPIIRTSVDHGTAEDIAWRGIADDTNLIKAIKLATHMVQGGM